MTMLKRSFVLLLASVLTLAPVVNAAVRSAAKAPPPELDAYTAHPKLVVMLVIDQFREDYLERYRADFKPRGFGLFLDHGAYFPDCYYDYANTQTAPGHSAIGTGAYTNGNGIGSDDWWDLSRNKKRPVSSVEDERYQLVGLPAGAKATPGASPRNLLASTVGDELRLDTKGAASVYGISLKDDAAILASGATANGAFWIDHKSGDFITSSYYMPQLPAWVQTFDTGGRIAQAEQEANTPNTKNFYKDVGRTPAAVSYELDFAQALIQNEDLGRHPVTDMLTISISSTDILGHEVGPDSDQQRQMVDAVDTDLDSFFTWLDKNIPGGLGNVWITLTADHGVAPSPAVAAPMGLNAAQWDVKKLVSNLNYAMNQKFSPGEKVEYLLPDQSLPTLSLNDPSFMRAGITEQEAEQAVQQALPPAVEALSSPPKLKQPALTKQPPTPTLFRSYTRVQLAGGALPDTAFGRLMAHSYTPNGGWYVRVVPDAFQMHMIKGTGTSHGTPYSYDRHVPLAFYGAPFAPGVHHGRVGPVDLAATLASLLGVNQPSASVGNILTQAFKPVKEVVYPKPKPAPRVRARRRAAHRTIAPAKGAAKAAPAKAAPAIEAQKPQ